MTITAAQPGKRKRLGLIVALLALIGAAAWIGSIRTAMPAAAGDSLFGTVTAPIPAHDTLRVATFNIDGGVGVRDDKLDLNRTATAVKGFDFVGLEEVHGSPTGPNQGQLLGGITGLSYLFAPVERRWGYESFGNGVLTSLPVTHWQRFPLSTAASATNRNVLLVRAMWHGRPINFLVTHLDRHEDHDLELGSVIDLFLALQEPAVLLADLNTTAADPRLQKLRAIGGVIDALHEKAGTSLTSENVDWIFARGLICVDGGFTDNGASDHHLAWVEFKEKLEPQMNTDERR